jgi:putative transposase
MVPRESSTVQGRTTSPRTEEPIACAMRQVEAGTPVAEPCLEMAVFGQAFPTRKEKCAGTGIVKVQRVKQSKDENRRLKRLVAERNLDRPMLQVVLRSRKREAGGPPRALQPAGGRVPHQPPADLEAGPARPVAIWPAKYREEPDSPLISLRQLAEECSQIEYPRPHVLHRRQGWQIIVKRVQRLNKREGLGCSRRKRETGGSLLRVVPDASRGPNGRKNMDFVQDSVPDVWKSRVLTVVDAFTRPCFAAHADGSIAGKQAAATMEDVA